MAINAASAQTNPDSGDGRTFPAAHDIFKVDPPSVSAASLGGNWPFFWRPSHSSASCRGTSFWSHIVDWNQSYEYYSENGTQRQVAEQTLWPGVHIIKVNHHQIATGSFDSSIKREGISPATGPSYSVG